MSIRDFERKFEGNGCPNRHVFVKQSLKDETPRNRRAGDGVRKEWTWESAEKGERLLFMSMSVFERKRVHTGRPNVGKLVM